MQGVILREKERKLYKSDARGYKLPWAMPEPLIYQHP